MMNNVVSGVEETKKEAPKDNQHAFNSQYNEEELIEEITQILNNLFEPNNLSNNAYLVFKAQGVTFHIPVRCIYEEKSIKAKTLDKDIINKAIEKAENCTATKRGDVIEYVKPKIDSLRKNISVKGTLRENENEFKQFVYAFTGAQEGIVSWNLNPQLSVTSIICRDEKFATDLFNYLSKTQYKDAPIDCQLNFESLYISALENVKRRKKLNDYPQNRPYMVPTYQQMAPFFFNQMNNGYIKNYYQPPTNFYMPNPGFDRPMNTMGMSMNPNINGSMNRPQNYYNKSGGTGRRVFNKKPRGNRGRYQKNGYKPSSHQPTNVEVNDSDFPPLSNENQGNQ
jgi:hypothetical protein